MSMKLPEKINIIRAGVMGANDGIISIAGIVLGVAAATKGHQNANFAIFIAGLAGTIAGMISMAAGEYVSVHSQSDAEKQAAIDETRLNKTDHAGQTQLVANQLKREGISDQLAQTAANEMMTAKPIETVVKVKHGFNLKETISPLYAALASFISFPIGASLPMTAILVAPEKIKLTATYLSVLLALILTGYFAAMFGEANRFKGSLRNILAGVLTMTITYLIGMLFHPGGQF